MPKPLDPSKLAMLEEWQLLMQKWTADLANAIADAINSQSFDQKEYNRGQIETLQGIINSLEYLKGLNNPDGLDYN